MENFQDLLDAFINNAGEYKVEPFGSGLIHKTFVVTKDNNNAFILQELNNAVFKWPEHIADNINLLSSWLNNTYSTTILPTPLKTKTNKDFHLKNGIYYRLIPFVEGSHSINVCDEPDQAYEAAKQFGNFTASFKDFDVTQLKPSIVDFHNLTFRWKQFRDALINGNQERIHQTQSIISQMENEYDIVAFYEKILASGSFKLRVTHHDTKISNVLFNHANKGICVIDLDTVMPGYFISDLGDMFRTYLSPANEEEPNINLVEARRDFYLAIVEGYKEKMSDQMTEDELKHIQYAGDFMIYMQALRFFTDYLNDDIYYHINNPENNLHRTINQLQLLKSFRAIVS